MDRIEQLFSNKKKDIFSVYFTAGFPKINDSLESITTLQREGFDTIEIRIRYSDPMRDAPVLQYRTQIALINGLC